MSKMFSNVQNCTALTLIIQHVCQSSKFESRKLALRSDSAPQMSSHCLRVCFNLTLDSWTAENASAPLMLDLIKQNLKYIISNNRGNKKQDFYFF